MPARAQVVGPQFTTGATTAVAAHRQPHPRTPAFRRRGMLAVAPALLFPWAPRRAQAMEFEVVKPEVLEGLRARDDAASFKCKGGMMDCDGDRREFAKQQQQDFAKKLAEKQEAEKKPANKEG